MVLCEWGHSFKAVGYLFRYLLQRVARWLFSRVVVACPYRWGLLVLLRSSTCLGRFTLILSAWLFLESLFFALFAAWNAFATLIWPDTCLFRSPLRFHLWQLSKSIIILFLLHLWDFPLVNIQDRHSYRRSSFYLFLSWRRILLVMRLSRFIILKVDFIYLFKIKFEQKFIAGGLEVYQILLEIEYKLIFFRIRIHFYF